MSDGIPMLIHITKVKYISHFEQAASSSVDKKLKKTKLRGLSPGVNYTDQVTAACRRH
jgi:hypothetical protein